MDNDEDPSLPQILAYVAMYIGFCATILFFGTRTTDRLNRNSGLEKRTSETMTIYHNYDKNRDDLLSQEEFTRFIKDYRNNNYNQN